MTPERWHQVKELFHCALEREPALRAAFLYEACAADEQLRKEVESLIAVHEKPENLIDHPAFEVAANLLATGETKSLEGRIIGDYKVERRIGWGGMGEVFLAQDMRLGRRVALKVLPASFTRDEDRVLRFHQEAHAASILNHPNIITIYEIGQVDSTHFIAAEFIEGETLRSHLKKAEMELSEILDVTIQVCNGLAAAHRAGIVHRDIKPENIMLRPDGYVKVLDFGLAKLTERLMPAIDGEAPTIVVVDTDPGMVMGTVSYMSPEQARGFAIDSRTDIFSLGIVLYEMVTSRMPFEGSSTSDVMVSILDKDPKPLKQYIADAPPQLQRIVSKVLAKDKAERFQEVSDLIIDLKSLKQELEFKSKLEPPDSAGSGSGVGIETSGKNPAAMTADEAAQIKESPVYKTSGAGHFISTRKLRKKSFVLSLAFFAMALVGIGFGLRMLGAPETPIDSVAVLPFDNSAANLDTEYLSDGITESIINSLSQLSQLRVMARSTVFAYKGHKVDPRKIGTDLNVRAVVTGKILQRGETLIIAAELVNARDGSQLWGKQYNRNLSDIFTVQEEIAREISESLRLRLSGKQKERLSRRYTENSEAYQLYLKGRYFWNKRSVESLTKGVEYFRQAVEKDPNYAPAYAGLADSYIILGNYRCLSPEEAHTRARDAAANALEIDEELAEAHAALAHVRQRYDWDWPGAEREFKRAVDLNPSYAPAHQWYAIYLSSVGRHDEAIDEIKLAQRLDPLSLIINSGAGWIFYMARRQDQAIEQCLRTLDLDPNFVSARVCLGQSYVQKGMYKEAIAELQKARLLAENPIVTSVLGYAYAASGQREEARKALDDSNGLSKWRRYTSSYDRAIVYAGLGDRDKAFELLQRAYEDRDSYMIWLKVEPILDKLRSDPRFADLERRVGIP
jgi:eukaryotic-like serine/threonine-protein kinase